MRREIAGWVAMQGLCGVRYPAAVVHHQKRVERIAVHVARDFLAMQKTDGSARNNKFCQMGESTLAIGRAVDFDTGAKVRTQLEKAEAFRALHEGPGAFIIPNPWDAGTAKLLAAMGFEALATTSLGPRPTCWAA